MITLVTHGSMWPIRKWGVEEGRDVQFVVKGVGRRGASKFGLPLQLVITCSTQVVFLVLS